MKFFQVFLQRSDKLFLTGIVAEFNPLHKGHEYLIKNAKKKGAVAVVLSGNFVQRGDVAIAEKGIRTQAALLAGADLVVELPVLWSMSTAQNFCLGGVSALKCCGCDEIMFGSEFGNIDSLNQVADILLSDEFKEKIDAELKKGITFAAARENAAVACGADSEILKGANNNLGIEYILAAKQNGYNINFSTVSRKGADHDSLTEAEFVSASLLRQKLLANDRAFCKKYMNDNILSLFSEERLSDIKRVERAILSVLRTKTKNELSRLPDLSEGVENKLFSAIRVASNLENLYNEIKVKRYTLARIRRLVLSAFLGAESDYFMKPLPYLRVLGFNPTGKRILSERLSRAEVPVITRTADVNSLDASAKKVFETECRATDLYGLTLNKPLNCGIEYTRKIINLE